MGLYILRILEQKAWEREIWYLFLAYGSEVSH